MRRRDNESGGRHAETLGAAGRGGARDRGEPRRRAGRDRRPGAGVPPERWCSSTSRSRPTCKAPGSATTCTRRHRSSTTSSTAARSWTTRPLPAGALRGQAEGGEGEAADALLQVQAKRGLERRKAGHGADFKATWQVYVTREHVISRAGWEEIKSVDVKGKRVTVVFKTPSRPGSRLGRPGRLARRTSSPART